MAWKLFFTLKPGAPRVFVHGKHKFNLSNAGYPLDRVFEAWNTGCPHLEITAKGRRKFSTRTTLLPLPDDLDERNIQVLSLDGDDDFDYSGSGNVEDTETPGSGSPSNGFDQAQAQINALTDVEAIEKAIELGVLEKKGTKLWFGGLSFGTKAILSNADALQNIRKLLVHSLAAE